MPDHNGFGAMITPDSENIARPPWRVPVTESTRFQSRVCLIQIQLISQATGVWVHLQAAAYSTGVR